MKFAGLDVGGAHIKFALSSGECKQVAFPFWKNKDQLSEILTTFADLIDGAIGLGVTMTAELADCFASKQDGVEFIVNSVERVFSEYRPLYYQTDGDMCGARAAIDNWQTVAASNWHASAWFVFSDSEQPSGFMFDIGSTTTDMIPVQSCTPVVSGQSDLDRLGNRQLLYAGVGRTPVCSLIDEIEFDSSRLSVARELFATTQDVFLWLGEIEPSDSTDTADGRPANRICAGHRLARMVCADFDQLTPSQIDAIAIQTRNSLTKHLTGCLQSVVESHPSVPLVFKTFGGGAWLAKEIIDQSFSHLPAVNPEVIPFSDDETANQTVAARAVAAKRESVWGQN